MVAKVARPVSAFPRTNFKSVITHGELSVTATKCLAKRDADRKEGDSKALQGKGFSQMKTPPSKNRKLSPRQVTTSDSTALLAAKACLQKNNLMTANSLAQTMSHETREEVDVMLKEKIAELKQKTSKKIDAYRREVVAKTEEMVQKMNDLVILLLQSPSDEALVKTSEEILNNCTAAAQLIRLLAKDTLT